MIRQRPAGSAPVVQAFATDLPFRDAAFAAAVDVLRGTTGPTACVASGSWRESINIGS
jgi:hypothetical protein